MPRVCGWGGKVQQRLWAKSDGSSSAHELNVLDASHSAALPSAQQHERRNSFLPRKFCGIQSPGDPASPQDFQPAAKESCQTRGSHRRTCRRGNPRNSRRPGKRASRFRNSGAPGNNSRQRVARARSRHHRRFSISGRRRQTQAPPPQREGPRCCRPKWNSCRHR